MAQFALGGDTPEAREFLLVPRADAPPVADLSFDPSVSWVNDGRYLGVVTVGSSSCPSGPEDVEVIANQEIAVRLAAVFPEQDPCTADLSPHVTVVDVPPGITSTQPLTARVGDVEVTLPAVGD